MEIIGTTQPQKYQAALEALGIKNPKTIYANLSRPALVEETLKRGQGKLSDTGALAVHTGEFTGRTPKDRFIVKDATTEGVIDWGAVNQPFPAENYEPLRAELLAYLEGKDVFVRENYVCADPQYRLNVRTITEYPWSNLFADNMFNRPSVAEAETMTPDWTIIQAPSFKCDASVHGTRRGNFAIMNFTKKEIIIGGTGYTGEIKKGIFAVLNFELPHLHKVLSMHCSANVGHDGDTAIFFGLSGTGKTTLSADPNRALVGDDEHGWSPNGVFNFEGGCYAKTINITEENEPEIFRAIKHGAILENIVFTSENGIETRIPDYASKAITENTRVSYPIEHIPNALIPSKAGIPNNIFFLTCDGFGVLPPISRLTKGQAMYNFISGYTAKIPGTEDEVDEPQPTFSACFGAPFLPLHPTKYAEMLGELMEKYNANVWLVNTGWVSGEFGVGSRIKLRYTRAMITAALSGQLNEVEYVEHDIFGLYMPTNCPNVPAELLNPRAMWADKAAYDAKASDLAERFVKNFEKYAAKANEEILAAAPHVSVV
jgi:phosphoenolpyruvate carboxykinase (ATP)